MSARMNIVRKCCECRYMDQHCKSKKNICEIKCMCLRLNTSVDPEKIYEKCPLPIYTRKKRIRVYKAIIYE